MTIDEGIANSNNLNSEIIALDTFVSELCSFGREIEKLNDPQRDFFFIQMLEQEVNNGGFDQYFINPSGEFAHETVLALQRIGANNAAAILQAAVNRFPEGSVPPDRDERIKLVLELTKKKDDLWDDLDEEFYQYPDDLNALNYEYVEKHKESFRLPRPST